MGKTASEKNESYIVFPESWYVNSHTVKQSSSQKGNFLSKTYKMDINFKSS